MIANFFQTVYKKLIEDNFNHLRHFRNETMLDENTRFVSLLKEEGASWYVILLANMEKVSIDEFLQLNNTYIEYFREILKRGGPSHIFITNILISETEHAEVDELIQNQEAFVLEPVNNTHWHFNLATGSIVANKNRPTKVLNIRSILDEAYKNSDLERYAISKNMGEIIASINDEEEEKHKERIKPLLSSIFMLANLAVFIAIELRGGPTMQNLVNFGAIHPALIFDYGEYFRLFTAVFIHGGAMHLASNMLGLYIFGTRVEMYYGRINFLVIYTFGGLFGSIFSLLFTRSVAVGASGAIFGLVGAVAVMAKITKKDIEGLNYHTMIIYIIISIGVGLLIPNVDNFGHLGGLISGGLIGFILYKCMPHSY